MNCHCQHETDHSHTAADNLEQVAVPCSLETLARLQAEYLPQTPVPKLDEPCHTQTASELVKQCGVRLKPKAEYLLDDCITPREYFERLLDNTCLAEARRVLALALPRRRALWWACLCSLDAYQRDPPEPVEQAVDLVTRFVRNPSEENRRVAESFGRSHSPNRLETCLAMAAFFSSGSVSLPRLPAVAPRPFVTGRLVSVCVYLASVTRSAAEYKAHLRQYLAIGVDIARGENLWHNQHHNSERLDQGDSDSNLHGMHNRQHSTTHVPHSRM